MCVPDRGAVGVSSGPGAELETGPPGVRIDAVDQDACCLGLALDLAVNHCSCMLEPDTDLVGRRTRWRAQWHDRDSRQVGQRYGGGGFWVQGAR